jgi:hypothetical protein
MERHLAKGNWIMNDWTINQLVELRTALLHVLDEGRLLPDGTRAPWGFYPQASTWMYEDQLPRSLSQADYNTWYAGSALLDGVRIGPTHVDWHMDESGDVNEQRTQFADEIQRYLVKEAQKANVEIIDVKARAF